MTDVSVLTDTGIGTKAPVRQPQHVQAVATPHLFGCRQGDFGHDLRGHHHLRGLVLICRIGGKAAVKKRLIGHFRVYRHICHTYPQTAHLTVSFP